MADRTRKTVLRCPVTEEEKLQILKNKDKSKIQSISGYLRKMALDGMIINVDLSEIKENTVAINRIGNNLNQITKRINVSADIEKSEIDEVKNLINEVMDMQNKLLREFIKIIM